MSLNLSTPGLGITIAIKDTELTTPDSAYTVITNALSLDGLGISWAQNDNTGLASVAEETAATLKSGDELTLNLLYDYSNATHAKLLASANANHTPSFQVTIPKSTGPGASGTTTSTWTFNASFTGFKISGTDPKAKLTAAVGLKPSGDLVIATGS